MGALARRPGRREIGRLAQVLSDGDDRALAGARIDIEIVHDRSGPAEPPARTGGTFLDLSRARALAPQFPGGEERREPISSRLEDAWDGWHTLLAALALLAAEWILRKRSQLL